MLSPTDTHSYDGKLDTRHYTVCSCSRAEKMKGLKHLESALKMRGGWCEKAVSAIVTDYESGSRSNYDTANKLDAGELLYQCYRLWQSDRCADVEPLLVAQLNEMSSGMCPQGRTTRLWQVLFTFNATEGTEQPQK